MYVFAELVHVCVDVMVMSPELVLLVVVCLQCIC